MRSLLSLYKINETVEKMISRSEVERRFPDAMPAFDHDIPDSARSTFMTNGRDLFVNTRGRGWWKFDGQRWIPQDESPARARGEENWAQNSVADQDFSTIARKFPGALQAIDEIPDAADGARPEILYELEFFTRAGKLHGTWLDGNGMTYVWNGRNWAMTDDPARQQSKYSGRHGMSGKG